MRNTTRSKQVVKEIDQNARIVEVVDRLREGATLSEIGELFGVTPATARRWRLKALESSQREMEMSTEGYRMAQVARREELIEAYWKQAIEGELEAARFVAQMFEQMERLLGLNVPIEREASTQTVYVLNLPGAVQLNALGDGGMGDVVDGNVDVVEDE